MLHTKPSGHWPFGSWEEDFWRVFTIYGCGGHLGHVTQTWPYEQTFVPPSHWGPIWNLALIAPAVLEKKSFENGGRTYNRWTTHGQQTTDDGPWLYYKLTNEPKGSGELIKNAACLIFYSALGGFTLPWVEWFTDWALALPHKRER